jgi:hypothetical protein
MAKYYCDRFAPVVTATDGCATVHHGEVSVTAALAVDDEIRAVRVPAGTEVHRAVIKVPDMDTNVAPTLEAKIGFIPDDGSATPTGADTAVKAAAAFAQGGNTMILDVFPPYVVEQDSYLNIVVTTAAATGTAGTIHGRVEGRAIGAL